jgi:hypothetical protein
MKMSRMVIATSRPLWRVLLQWFFTGLGVLAFGLLMAVLLVEWMVGCGESYVDSKGLTHPNECVFINRGDAK